MRFPVKDGGDQADAFEDGSLPQQEVLP